MVKVEMTEATLGRITAGLETAIALVEKRIAETHSGIDKFMLESFIIETREALAELEAQKLNAELTDSVVFNYAPVPQPEG